MDLSFNRFEGALPDLGKLKELTWLDLNRLLSRALIICVYQYTW